MPQTLHWTGAAADGAADTAANYLEAAAPTTGDTVVFRARALVDGTAGDQDLDASLDQSSIRLAAIHVEQSFTGKIGSAIAPLQIGAGLVEIGVETGFGTPQGSPRINLSLPYFSGQAAPVVTVYDTADSSAEEYLPPVRLLFDDPAAVLHVRRGAVGVGVLGEEAELSAIHVSYVDRIDADAVVEIGPNVTLATVDKTGGRMTLRSAATTVGQSAGSLVTEGDGAIAALTVTGGTIVSNASGTITAAVVGGGADDAVLDLSRSRVARAVTTMTISAGGTLKVDPAIVTLTNKVTASGPVTLSASDV